MYQLGDWKETTIDTAKATAAIATDPHLPEVVCHVLNLQRIAEGEPGGRCNPIPVRYAPGKGVGLRDAVVPLRYYVQAKKHPVAAAAIATGVVVGIFLLGYVLGKGAR